MARTQLVHLSLGDDLSAEVLSACFADSSVIRVNSLAELRGAMTGDAQGVVLTELRANPDFLTQVADCVMAGHHMRWIALLTLEQLASEAVRRLVADHFMDYHTLPVDTARLKTSVGHAMGMSRLQAQLAASGTIYRVEGGLVGSSPSMVALQRAIGKVAPVDAPVLINGESGTGKELAAQAIHKRSPRACAPFVAVNCGALPASLIDSELFGYERGAFTGANQRHIGRIEAAASGTVFLDEIGEMPMELQVHLLRFLEEGTIDRLGGNNPVHPDTRVIAATNVDLEAAVAQGRFREDLFYRLNVLRLDMPPLRDRPEDIELLARYFFERFHHERASGVRGFTRDAINAMEAHTWPGNVRELINRVRRAMVMCERRLIAARDLGLDRREQPRPVTTLEEARSDAERRAVMTVMRACRCNVTRAAEQLGVSRVTMYRLMEKHGVSADALTGNA